MIKLTLYPSKNVHYYSTKSKALKDIKDNGLKAYQYSLENTFDDTQYKSGLWLNKAEMEALSSGYNIKQIKIYRKYNKKNKRRNYNDC